MHAFVCVYVTYIDRSYTVCAHLRHTYMVAYKHTVGYNVLYVSSMLELLAATVFAMESVYVCAYTVLIYYVYRQSCAVCALNATYCMLIFMCDRDYTPLSPV